MTAFGQNKRRLIVIISLFLILNIYEVSFSSTVFASVPIDPNQDIQEQYLTKMKKIYGFKLETFDSLDWLVILGMSIASFIAIIVFCYLIFNLFYRLWLVNIGKASIGDRNYWVRMSVSLLLLFAFISGSIFVLLEKFFGGVIQG